jgi:murein DD-endopeptidase MepM/ murein hydrolase activator NlpD
LFTLGEEDENGRIPVVPVRIQVFGPIYRSDLAGSGVASDVGLRQVNGVRQYHTGLDLGTVDGTAIHAIYAGTLVQYIEDDNIYGNYAIVEHEAEGITFYSLYAHLQGLAENTQVDQELDAGQQFALSGHSGFIAPNLAVRPHLHLSTLNEAGYVTRAPVNVNDDTFYNYYHRVPVYPAYDYSNLGVAIPYRTGPTFPRYF